MNDARRSWFQLNCGVAIELPQEHQHAAGADFGRVTPRGMGNRGVVRCRERKGSGLLSGRLKGWVSELEYKPSRRYCGMGELVGLYAAQFKVRSPVNKTAVLRADCDVLGDRIISAATVDKRSAGLGIE